MFFAMMLLICLVAVCVTACGQSDSHKDVPAASQLTVQEYREYISAVPKEYFEEADQPTHVARIEYESRDYTADTGIKIRRTI